MKLRSIASVSVFIYLSTASVAVAPIQNLVTLEETERMAVKTSTDAFFPLVAIIPAGRVTGDVA